MKKAILIILDGWGISPEKKGNGIFETETKTFDALLTNVPHLLLKASSQEVGLPWGEVGNSEVGHLNIGLGRVVLQDLPQIDKSIRDKSFFQRPALNSVKDHLQKSEGRLHIMGIASDGAVHGHLLHITNLLEWASKNSIRQVFLHLFSDGRDTLPKVIEGHIKEIKRASSKFKTGLIVSLSGRYFAMDRDAHWDRIEKTYKVIVEKTGDAFETVEEGVKSAYQKNQTDEFIEPFMVKKAQDTAIKDGDALIFTNYRTDRAIQLTKALIDPNFNAFPQKKLENFLMVTMTDYEDNLPVETIFSSVDLNNPKNNPLTKPLAEVVSKAGLKQLHLAETEKYAHVTYFFNGGHKKTFSGEDQVLVQSPQVATYDLKPEMSVSEVTNKFLTAIKSQKYDFILVNYANPDMVGHTGKPEAIHKAIQIVDESLGKVLPEALKNQYQVFLAADHGNADQMVHFETKSPHKEHTINPVPFFYLTPGGKLPKKIKMDKVENAYIQEPTGILADIAPTILAAMELTQPEEMVGTNLLDQFQKIRV